MNRYPIGIQSFEKIKTNGLLYIDKTQIIYNLVSSFGYFFLSRPRRFGKSLLLSTVKELFEGNKSLFEGLWIYDKWNWEQTHPVIHISFSNIGVSTMGLVPAIYNALKENALRLGITLSAETYDQQFKELIIKAAAGGNVVILIDEYDRPITDYLDNLEKVEEHRAIFKSLYSILKDADAYIRLLILTGVSKFSKASIFSDLNNIRDITMAPDFVNLVGITQNELEVNFAAEISEMQQTRPDILADIKRWYNGYSWDGENRIYNPFSILNFMADRKFKNYWFQTGTPTWLVNHMRDQMEYKLEDLHYSENDLSYFNTTAIESVPLLFQTGYLTLKGYDESTETYELGYPNKEVEDSLSDALLNAYRNVNPGNSSSSLTTLLTKGLKSNNIPQIIKAIDTAVSTVPYPLWNSDKESIFNIILYLSFNRAGAKVQSEQNSAQGRSDLTVYTPKYIYVFVLKINGSAQAALDQIFEKGYLRPFQTDPRKKIAIGVNFSSEKRAVDAYVIKEVE